MKICNVDDCGERYYAKGFCRPHYEKHRKTGFPLCVVHKHEGSCLAEWCNKEDVIRTGSLAGYCKNHYYQMKKHKKIFLTIHDISTDERFNSRIKKNIKTKCWDWNSTLGGSGYGEFRINGKLTKAHRYSYEKNKGKIPEGLNVLHKCDRPCCVNPDHLFLGTQKDNVMDMDSKGRRNPPLGSKNGNSKLKEGEIRALKSFLAINTNTKTLSLLFNVNQSTVRKIKNKNIWSHI